MLTITKDVVLPATITGSLPRPRWFDVSMWGRPLDTCMLDVRFREKFTDALAVLLSDQERAGLDIVTHGDLHWTRTWPAASWHHYPLQRWAGFEGDYLQPEATRSPVAALSARHAAERDLHRLALAARRGQNRAPPARLPQDLAHRAERTRKPGQVRHLLLAGDGACFWTSTRRSTTTSAR